MSGAPLLTLLSFLAFCVFAQARITSRDLDKLCVKKDGQTKQCEISNTQTEVCGKNGRWDGSACVCDLGYTGTFCQDCAPGRDRRNCTKCAEGFAQGADGRCWFCPCNSYNNRARRIDKRVMHDPATKTSHFLDDKNPCNPSPDKPAYPDYNYPNEDAHCYCEEGWAGIFCSRCATDYYPKTSNASAVGTPCSVQCNKALTCGNMGECTAEGKCICMLGSYLNETGTNCVRCVKGESKMVGGVNVCDSEYIQDPVTIPIYVDGNGNPVAPMPGGLNPPQTPSTKRDDECPATKWWIGFIIAGAAALLLALIAGAVLVLMSSGSKKPGEV